MGKVTDQLAGGAEQYATKPIKEFDEQDFTDVAPVVFEKSDYTKNFHFTDPNVQLEELDEKGIIKVWYAPEFTRQQGDCMACCACCPVAAKKRTYMLIRENAIEHNYAINNGFCGYIDMPKLMFYDKSPLVPKGCFFGVYPFPCCIIPKCVCAPLTPKLTPKMEWVDDRQMICCIKCPHFRHCLSPCLPCCFSTGEAVSVMPSRKGNCPMCISCSGPKCCCGDVRVRACDNFCGCYGKVTGVAKETQEVFAGFDGRGEAIKVANVIEYAYHIHRNKVMQK